MRMRNVAHHAVSLAVPHEATGGGGIHGGNPTTPWGREESQSTEERERARLHAELDAKLDAERRAGIASDLDAAARQSAAGSGGGAARSSASGAAVSFARGSAAKWGELSGSDRSTPRDVANVRMGAKVVDPFLDLLGESMKGPSADIRAPELQEAVRAARERTRQRQPRASDEPDERKASTSSSSAWAARKARTFSRDRGHRRDGGRAAGHVGGGDAADASSDRAGSESLSTKGHHRRIAAEMSEKRERRRQKKKAEAASHVGGWAQAHKSIYEQLSSLPSVGPPIFPQAWTAGDVARGNAKQLKRAYHRAAAKLHPDKVADLPEAAQALAEELFKSIGEAYQKEVKRIEENPNPTYKV